MLLCFLGLNFFSCKSRYLPENYKKEQLFFGSGGGFTGAISTWCLQESGRIYHKESSDSTYVEVKKLSSDEAAIIFSQIDEMGLNEYQLENPGNMYNFIQLGLDEDANRIVWDKMSAKIKPDIKAFYDRLMELTQITE